MAAIESGCKSKDTPKIKGTGTQDMSGIPHPCQYTDLCLSEPTKIRDESMSWIRRLDKKMPIWSRLFPSNCVGNARDISFTKEKNYCTEIPRRLFSLWGNRDTHEMVIEKMSNLKKYQWVSNVLICCAAVRYNLNDWYPGLLDDIVYRGCIIFSELCQKNTITNQDFCMHHMNSLMHFRNTSFRVKVELKAQGFMYMPYGYGKYNLARALTDFFLNYQFGLLECQNRCLAFGFATDVEQGYFMYDCQSEGAPLLNNNAANAYVLRTDHLQILLYCLTVAVGVIAENIKFKIYNVDVVIEDMKERATSKQLNVLHHPPAVDKSSYQRKANQKQLESSELSNHHNKRPADRKFKGVTFSYNLTCDIESKNMEDKAYLENSTSKGRSQTGSLLQIGVKGDRKAGGHGKVIEPVSPKIVAAEFTTKAVQQSSNPLQPTTAVLQNKSPNDLIVTRGTDLVELYDITKANVLGVKVYLVNTRPKKEQSSELQTVYRAIHKKQV